MKKKIFTEIKKGLSSLYPPGVQGHALTRLNTLSGLVTGMINSKSSHIPAICQGRSKNNKIRTQESHAQRFLENKYTDYKVHYLPFLATIIYKYLQKLQKSGKKLELRIVIDGTQINAGHCALMLSLVVGSRSIPICWVVKAGKKGHFKTDMHLEVLKQAAIVFEHIFTNLDLWSSFSSKQIPITLLGDGEFDSVELQQLCQKDLHWNYVVRTAKDSKLYENGDEFEPQNICFDKLSSPEAPFVFIEDIEFSSKKLKNVSFLYWHDKQKYQDPIFLLSNLDDPFLIIEAYEQRFAIETLFKDLKTKGFNLHKNRQTKTKAIDSLILIAALAFGILMNFGEQNTSNPLKINIVREDKNSHSLFFFAYSLFDYCCLNGLEFSFEMEENLLIQQKKQVVSLFKT